ncbi:YhgE/Pip family protein [Herbiconiux daphne]|uniref:YhgE/Pip family protein n=1 Tax=Herbiconiux daphne TaxID=2970914 RepID=A0ABT2H3U9_9MICO|nr:YhgE/Pip family protein [Herbiconiux daphne]MCS5734610.1 YhgE/Pip family protein [Herbiconiux daphne]
MSASTTTPTPRTRRRTTIAIVVLAVLGVIFTPLAVNGLFAGALSNADTNLSTIPAAIVNNDKMTTTTNADGTETTNFAGRGLVTELTGDGETGFDWQATNSDDAQKGLENGTYYAVLTIPEDFSATLNTVATADPKQGLIDITTDDAHGYLSGIVASTVASAVQSGFGQQITATVVNGLYTGLGGVGTSLSDAAGGATQLASGADQLATGAGQLADGLNQLGSGAATAASGATQLSTGVTAYTGGVSQLATGLDQLAAQTAPIAQLPAGITGYVGQVDVAKQNLDNALAEIQTNPTVSVEAQTALATAQGYLAGLSTTGPGGSQLISSTAGLGSLPGGIAQLASGADQLAAGGPELASGASGLADGVSQLATGVQQTVPGAQQLGTGATQLGDGARTLASGLQSGADQITANASSDADGTSNAADVIAQPVKVDVNTVNQVSNISQVVSTILVPTALWIGALAVFLFLRPFSRAVLASSASTARLTTRTFARAGGIAAAQVVLLVGFLHIGLGVAWSSLPATLGFSLLVALAFTAFHQLLSTAFGRVGAVVSLVLLALQLAATGGLYPVEILSGPFQVISAISPMSYAVSGIQTILTGGDAGTVVTAALVMAALLLASILLSGVALARRRRPVEIGWLVPARGASPRPVRHRPASPSSKPTTPTRPKLA